jgi:hypothetical protein
MARIVKPVLVAAWIALAGLLAVAPANADEEGESDQSRVLVQQAIALIVNTPDDEMAIEERINDALKAPDTEGADLDMVKQAMTALESGNLNRTRSLLQTSIGAGPYLGEGVPPDVGETTGEPGQPPYAVGEESGTTIVLDELGPGRDFDAGNVVLLALSGLSIAAGLSLAWRYRPQGTVHQMRRTLRAGGQE